MTNEALNFLARRVFAPDRLLLLREELATLSSGPWPGDAKLEALRSETEDLERAMDNQALTFDANPPEHPMAQRASKRILELHDRSELIKDVMRALRNGAQ